MYVHLHICVHKIIVLMIIVCMMPLCCEWIFGCDTPSRYIYIYMYIYMFYVCIAIRSAKSQADKTDERLQQLWRRQLRRQFAFGSYKPTTGCVAIKKINTIWWCMCNSIIHQQHQHQPKYMYNWKKWNGSNLSMLETHKLSKANPSKLSKFVYMYINK